MIGLGVIVIYVFTAVFGPHLAPHDPYKQNLARKLEGPSLEHAFGNNELGRDILFDERRILAIDGRQGYGFNQGPWREGPAHRACPCWQSNSSALLRFEDFARQKDCRAEHQSPADTVGQTERMRRDACGNPCGKPAPGK